MSLANMLFNMYKKLNVIFKILLCPLLLVILVLWIVGSLAHANTLVMFLVGCIVGLTLTYIYHDYIFSFINNIIEMINYVVSLI